MSSDHSNCNSMRRRKAFADNFANLNFEKTFEFLFILISIVRDAFIKSFHREFHFFLFHLCRKFITKS